MVQGFVIVDLKASLLGIEASSVYSLLPVYDVNTDTTSIVAASAIFNSGMVGMAFYPDSTSRNAYEIVGYVSSTNIIVAGNVNKVDDLGTTMQVCRRGIITEESGRVLLDVDAAFTSPMSGWRVELNLEKSAILNLGGYVSGSKMQLQGDPLFLVDLRTERYHIAAPPGVCGPNTGTSYSATGATADPRDRNKANASNPGSRYLWAGYMYLTPIVGVWNGSSIQGSQSGINKLGQYHCWHRTYDVSTGRWTTPDPAASPWRNLFDHSRNRPMQITDPNGLVAIFIHGAFGGTHGQGIKKMKEEHQEDGGQTAEFRDFDFDKIVQFICDLKCADNDEPVCLVGYSWGGATAIKVAQHFAEHVCLCQTGSRWYGSENCGSGVGSWVPEFEVRRVEIRYIALIDAVFSWTGINEWYPQNYLTSYRNFWALPNIYWIGLLWGAWPGVPSWMRLPWFPIKWTDHLAIIHDPFVQKRIREDLKTFDKRR